MDIIKNGFINHHKVLEDTMDLIPVVQKMAEICLNSLRNGNKILICGNGGSAADAQHIAAELIGRFCNERISLPSNDYNYDMVFSRQVEGLGVQGDVFWGITTSGNSTNVIAATETAKELGLTTIISTGKDGGMIKNVADVSLIIPSNNTARIQEMHMLCAHLRCEIIDQENW